MERAHLPVHTPRLPALHLLLSSLRKTFLTPPTIGIGIGCVIGLNEPLRSALFSKAGALSFVGGVVTLLGQCSVPVANLILAGSLSLGLQKAQDARAARQAARRPPEAADTRLVDVPVAQEEEAWGGALAAPTARGGKGAPHAAPLAFAVGMEEGRPGGSLGAHPCLPSPPPPPPPPTVSWRTIAVLAGTRLLLCPAVLFTLYGAAEAWSVPGLTGADPVLRLVILLEAASPCAQTVLLLAETVGASGAARDLSIAFLVVHPLSLLTMTGWLAVAMRMVFPSKRA